MYENTAACRSTLHVPMQRARTQSDGQELEQSLYNKNTKKSMLAKECERCLIRERRRDRSTGWPGWTCACTRDELLGWDGGSRTHRCDCSRWRGRRALSHGEEGERAGVRGGGERARGKIGLAVASPRKEKRNGPSWRRHDGGMRMRKCERGDERVYRLLHILRL